MNRKEFGRSPPLSNSGTVPDFAGGIGEKHEEESEICGLLVCYAAQNGVSVSTFLGNLSVLS